MKRCAMVLAWLLCAALLSACGEKAAPAGGVYTGEKLPALQLVAEEESVSCLSGNYSWTWPRGDGQHGGIIACGAAPTDPMVWKTREHIRLSESVTVKLVWPEFPAHSVTVTAWDTQVFDPERSPEDGAADPFLRDAVLTEDGGERTLVLEPDRVYDIYAYWQEVNGSAYGNAHYYVITQGA